MTNYQEGRVKLTNTKLNKLRSAEKKKQKKTLRWRIGTEIVSNNKTNI